MQIEPTKWTPRQQKREWLNFIAHVHDYHCNCNKPLEHTVYNIFEQEKELRFNTETKQLIKQCLSTDGDADHGDAATTVDALDAGTLEDLFAEDFTDDTG
ncbi:MAG: hypothetical protein [Betatorquevirus homini24]|uniref:Hepatitis TT virus Orf2/Gyrovirus Vp2 N-terminal domain-containing protein n=1 Tax=Anelloviridae sp. TaxID=2055263 RepID=A0A385E3E2_9VIRU|nr:MAG: hypothetical protein QKC57_gp2 [Anelloviridae sp.]AXQ66280.1 MAG: hypothetical protein [Anelloviridae sp.]